MRVDWSVPTIVLKFGSVLVLGGPHWLPAVLPPFRFGGAVDFGAPSIGHDGTDANFFGKTENSSSMLCKSHKEMST